MWRPEDNLQESVLAFYLMDAGNQSQVIMLIGKAPYLLSHLASPAQQCYIFQVFDSEPVPEGSILSKGN